METLDHMTDSSKLWRTIKAIDGKSPLKAEKEAITFDDTQVSSPKQIANRGVHHMKAWQTHLFPGDPDSV